jgi:cytochrome c peroxidase
MPTKHLLRNIVAVALAGSLTSALGALTPDPAPALTPVTDADFYRNGQFAPAQVELGRMLFFDKILSGNENIACATCHHPTLGTSDARSLAFGEGATGLGRKRRVGADRPVLGRLPRNAPSLYFLGAAEFASLFHDGRVEVDQHRNWPSGFWTPAREQLPAGLDNVLAAQAMFPVTSAVEMAGRKGENPVATAAALDNLDGPEGVWALLARRLQAIAEYVELFRAAYSEVKVADDISFVLAANAIAAFETQAFRADDSPFDRYLRSGDRGHLGMAAQRGLELFNGAAGCSACHSDKFQTDQSFHAIAMPQLGPGKNDGFDQSYWQATGFAGRLEDLGRYRVTNLPDDKYRFRTPSLRNVELTGPWGHSGAYRTLEAVVRHHLDPVTSLHRYDVASAELPQLRDIVETTATGSQLIYRPVNPRRLDDYLRRDTWVMQSAKLRAAIADANQLHPTRLGDQEVADLVAFLGSLTDPRSRSQHDLAPKRVPSGLPVAD